MSTRRPGYSRPNTGVTTMSNRAAEYRALIEDVAANVHLLEDDERMELQDMLARVERKMLANMPAQPTQSEAAE